MTVIDRRLMTLFVSSASEVAETTTVVELRRVA
jgi:hypothetical protein